MKGYFRKRGDKWSFTVDLGKDPTTGKRKQKTLTGFKTKKEAEKTCNELLSQINKGMYVNETSQTINEFLNYWLNVYVYTNLRKRTIDNYEKTIKNYIAPSIGYIKLKDFTVTMAQNFFTKLTKKKLSPTTVKSVYIILNSALKQAVEWELINKNVVIKVKVPKVEKKSRITWNVEEITKFLSCSSKRNKNYYICFLLAIYTGMRKSEILGLQWKDIDFKEGKIKVVRSLLEIKGGGYEFDEVKSNSSKRTIAIDEYLLQQLKRHKVNQGEAKLQLGSKYNDLDLIISTHKGTPINQKSISSEFYLIQERQQLPRIRFHDLRHTHATLLLQIGENVKVISERLGHADISITLDTYSHVIPDMQKSAAKNFSNALKNIKLN